MTNETKQLEVLAKVRELFDHLKEYAVVSDDCQYGTLSTSLVKDMADQALSLLDSVQVTSESVAWMIETSAGQKFLRLTEPHPVDGWVAIPLCDHAKPCARCAELEATTQQWREFGQAKERRFVERGIQIATLEAENANEKRAAGALYAALENARATIAQQAEEIKELKKERGRG